jgi:hypothetical protein
MARKSGNFFPFGQVPGDFVALFGGHCCNAQK